MSFTITNAGVDAGSMGVREDARLTGWLRTEGARVVDRETGEAVHLVGANWFGAEGENRVPNGLWARNYKEMMDEMLEAGMNTLRLPISPEVLDDGEPGGIRWDINPELVGRSAIEVMDAIVEYAGQIGLRVFIDMHRRDAGVGKQEDGLWHGEGYSLEDMAADWQEIAGRYAGDPTVVGFEVFNEPSGRGEDRAHWGEEGRPASSDWAAAAEVLGNAILEANPDALIMVQGVHIYEDKWYWVGGNLKGVAERPIELEVEDRLVYSAHDYPYSVVHVPWLEDATPEQMLANFREHWGYIVEAGEAPVLITETGGHLRHEDDPAYFDALFGYLAELDEASPGTAPGVTWWGWNPNSGDTGGLLKHDWRTVREDKLAYLDGLEAPLLPATAEAAARLADDAQTLAIDTGGTKGHDRVFHYAIEEVEGGAVAGRDFEPETGVLHIPAGERFAEIDVRVLAGAEGGEDGPGAVGVTIEWTNGGQHSRHEVVLEAPIERAEIVALEPEQEFVFRGEDEAAITVSEGGEQLEATLTLIEEDRLRLELDDLGLGRDTGIALTLLDPDALRVTTGGVSGGADGVVIEREVRDETGALAVELTVQDMEAFAEAPELIWSAARMGLGEGTAHEGEPPTGDGGLRVSYVIEQRWGEQFFGRITIENAGHEAIEGWSIDLDSFDFAFDEVHKAQLTGREDGGATIAAPGWDDDLAPGESFTFGFDGVMLEEATDLDLEAVADSLEFDLV